MACGFVVGKNSKIDLEIKGNVVFKGGLNEDGIRLHEGSIINIYGNGELICSGNDEKEFNLQNNDMATKAGKAYGNTSDESFKNIGGSGIGVAPGEIAEQINITGLIGLDARGYGKNAFGIGGNVKKVKITNTKIDYVRGGYGTMRDIEDPSKVSDIPSNEFILESKTYTLDGQTMMRYQQGKNEAEGGSAIGVAYSAAGQVGIIELDNVIIDKAHGGSKAAAIGSRWWHGATITIKNSKLAGIKGGNASAAIGGSRFEEGAHLDIKITDSEIEAEGGQFASAIGSGYNCYCTPFARTNNLNISIDGKSKITAKGGVNGSAIGTGYHNSRLAGSIGKDVELNLSLAEPFKNIDISNCSAEDYAMLTSGGWKYADNQYGTLSKPQTVGYGVLYTHLGDCDKNTDGEITRDGRECVVHTTQSAEEFDASVKFTVAGTIIDNPRAEENIMSHHSAYPEK